MLTLIISLLVLLFPLLANALPSGFSQTLITANLTKPVSLKFAPDGRIFVCQQGGTIRIIKNGVLLPTPFLSITVNSTGERGLSAIAFDPDFATNHYVYVHYTATSPAVHNRVSRFTAAGDVAAANSEVIILELDNLGSSANHNGGAMQFGSDRKLYITTGDNENGANSQSLANLFGKVLRINKNGTIPTDNPFYNTAAGKNRAIWSLGLRNPFSFTFQRGTTRMFINDVGAASWEEINDGIKGANYGWSAAEGSALCGTYKCPVFAYARGSGGAIVGAAFYNPPTVQFPSGYVGDYFYADFSQGWIRKYDVATKTVANFASGLAFPVDVRVHKDGTLYYLIRGATSSSGAVYRVRYQ